MSTRPANRARRRGAVRQYDDVATPAPQPGAQPGSRQEIARRTRIALTGCGVVAWAAGGTATFLTTNGSGAVALVGSGVAATLLGLMGRWPQRVSLSGNEIGWDEVKEAVESSIAATERDPDAGPAVQELRTLLDRLDRLRETGQMPEHPAALYDAALRSALLRLFPDGSLIAAARRSREVPDFALHLDGRTLHVESKWRQDVARPMEGSTLPRLASTVGDRDVLLVVSNALDVSAADRVVQDLFPGRSRVVTWRDVRDDEALAAAVRDLAG
jgi:hypothetical protein